MDDITDIKIIRGDWDGGKYSYNVQIYHNGAYCGHGRFVKSYAEAVDYITTELNGDDQK
jgi:hypothetical protein